MDTINMDITKTDDTYECPRHGKHDATVHVTIKGVLERVYCMHCMVEVYDSIGIKEMHKAKRDKKG